MGCADALWTTGNCGLRLSTSINSNNSVMRAIGGTTRRE
ncbi:unnamed protein product [Larinioides sclopetarius]|uniref:Uncharacterized protein n=1 Tax=Larinioides sclopetarius TaxID=280406 RepID=A0AAV2BLM1_9ARAC